LRPSLSRRKSGTLGLWLWALNGFYNRNSTRRRICVEVERLTSSRWWWWFLRRGMIRMHSCASHGHGHLNFHAHFPLPTVQLRNYSRNDGSLVFTFYIYTTCGFLFSYFWAKYGYHHKLTHSHLLINYHVWYLNIFVPLKFQLPFWYNYLNYHLWYFVFFFFLGKFHN
jgi:hypothetical protein